MGATDLPIWKFHLSLFLLFSQGYDGIRITKNAWDSPFSSVNDEYLAVVLEAAGGGSFTVIPLSEVSFGVFLFLNWVGVLSAQFI